MGVRTISGRRTCSLYIQGILAAWLRSWSMARAKKSPNMISTMAGLPRIAMPAATPTIPASLIGVAWTRSGNALDSPRVALNAPP
jgi:hypothetical protein